MIKVSNLGKKYTLRHKLSERRGYRRLSEDLTQALTWPVRRLHRALNNDNGKELPDGSKEDFWALRDVCFEVKQGEVVGIIGRNGAGKSTLLKLLSRITEPTTGRIELYGRVASLLEVGTGFHPELTGRENIFLNGAILGMTRSEIKRKFDEIVAFAEVEKFLDTPVKHFSSGMYVRLAFSVAAHLEPEILIVDEVLAVGDAEFQKKCLGKMQDVSTAGRTVLFVSHNMSVIQSLCHQAILFDQGRVSQHGPTSEVVQAYMSSGAADSSFAREVRSSEAVTLVSGTAAIDYLEDKSILNLSFKIAAKTDCNVSLDIRLKNAFGTAVGLLPVGTLSKEGELKLTGGISNVRCEHDITQLANGSYLISVDVAEPTISYLDRIEDCMSVEHNPPLKFGQFRALSQSWNFGCVEFPLLRSECQPDCDAAKHIVDCTV